MASGVATTIRLALNLTAQGTPEGRRVRLNSDGMVALVLAITLGYLTWEISCRRSGAFNPLVVHNGVWIIALVVFASRLIDYDDIQSRSWALLAAGLAGVNIPSFLVSLPDQPLPKEHERKPAHEHRPWPGCTLLIPILFAIGIALYLGAVAGTYGIERLISDPGLVRSTQDSEEFLDSFPLPARLCYFLGPFVFFCYASPKISGVRAPRVVRWSVLFFTLAAMMLSLGRTLPFVALAWAGVASTMGSWHRVSRGQRLKRAVLCAAAALTIFQVLGAQLGKLGTSDLRYQQHVTNRSLQESSLTSLVVYITGSIPAFNNLVTDPSATWAYGRYTAGPLLKVFPVAPEAKEISPFVNVPFPTNSYTYLEPYYRDFGAAGIVVFAVLIGFILVKISDWSSNGGVQLAIASLFIGLSAWGPFVNKYTSSFTWEYLIILILIGRAVRHPVRDVRQSADGVVFEMKRPASSRVAGREVSATRDHVERPVAFRGSD